MIASLRERILAGAEPLWVPVQKWIQAELAPRYEQMEKREQRLVLTAACLLPVLLLVFLIIFPLQDRQKELRQSVTALQLQAMEADQLAQQLIASGGSKGTQPVNVLSSVERIARESKVRQYMTRIRPQSTPDARGQQLMVQLKNAPYQDIVRFVDALAREKLELNSMKIQAGESAGLTHVQAVIGTR